MLMLRRPSAAHQVPHAVVPHPSGASPLTSNRPAMRLSCSGTVCTAQDAAAAKTALDGQCAPLLVGGRPLRVEFQHAQELRNLCTALETRLPAAGVSLLLRGHDFEMCRTVVTWLHCRHLSKSHSNDIPCHALPAAVPYSEPVAQYDCSKPLFPPSSQVRRPLPLL